MTAKELFEGEVGEATGSQDGDGEETTASPTKAFGNQPRQIEFSGQRALVTAQRLDREYVHDFLHPLSDEQINVLIDDCTEQQKLAIVDYFRRVLNGILLIKGSAGAGKSFLLKKGIELQLEGGKSVLFSASANVGVNNISGHIFELDPQEKFLKIRFWSDHLKESILKKADPRKLRNFARTIKSEADKKPDLIGFVFDWSLESAVLKVAKVIPTNN
jgi:hypothetical protein